MISSERLAEREQKSIQQVVSVFRDLRGIAELVVTKKNGHLDAQGVDITLRLSEELKTKWGVGLIRIQVKSSMNSGYHWINRRLIDGKSGVNKVEILKKDDGLTSPLILIITRWDGDLDILGQFLFQLASVVAKLTSKRYFDVIGELERYWEEAILPQEALFVMLHCLIHDNPDQARQYQDKYSDFNGYKKRRRKGKATKKTKRPNNFRHQLH